MFFDEVNRQKKARWGSGRKHSRGVEILYIQLLLTTSHLALGLISRHQQYKIGEIGVVEKCSLCFDVVCCAVSMAMHIRLGEVSLQMY